MISLYFQKRILSLHENGQAINNIQRITGHSRNTVRKVIRIKQPYSFKISPRPSKLEKYKSLIKKRFVKGTLSREQIFQEITRYGFDGSFSTLSNFLTKLKCEKAVQTWKAKQSGRKRRENLQRHTEWIVNLLQKKLDMMNLRCNSLK